MHIYNLAGGEGTSGVAQNRMSEVVDSRGHMSYATFRVSFAVLRCSAERKYSLFVRVTP